MDDSSRRRRAIPQVMLARLFVLLPFSLTIPEGEQFPVYEYADQGYLVRVCPPRRSDRPGAPLDDVDEILLDGAPAYQGDALWIDFHKESFDRSKVSLDRGMLDPPQDVLRRAVSSFLMRLRHVIRAPNVRPDFPVGTWRIRYLNDDGTELEPDERLVRVASRVVGKIRNGAFFRLVKLTTNVPPARAAIGGTRHGQEYQEVGWST